MLLGIDFGTTRTVVAHADRGNYPIVSFQSANGEMMSWHPSLIAARANKRLYGFDAQDKLLKPGWSLLRSFKRYLTNVEADIPVGRAKIPAIALLTEYLTQLYNDLKYRSNLIFAEHEKIEVYVAVPANANGNQRFITLEAFRHAGFEVRGMLNEPSAAGLEYAHRYLKKNSKKAHVLVYDLGGGTFDVSIISMVDKFHCVVANDGVNQLGGDDFDEILSHMALPNNEKQLSHNMRHNLLEECREKKEALHYNTQRIFIDLSHVKPDLNEVIVSCKDYYQQCEPLVNQSITAIEHVVKSASHELSQGWKNIAAVYLTGGSCDLPIVSRLLRKRYNRLIRKSPYPHAATAIGLAIAADENSGYVIKEKFTRHFGVWRESDDGQQVIFDPIFPKGTILPDNTTPLISRRTYQPVHNIGHFRYIECSQIYNNGQPGGDITYWNDILFPLDESLSEYSGSLDDIAVERNHSSSSALIEERYQCNKNGIIEVTICNHANGYSQHFQLKA